MSKPKAKPKRPPTVFKLHNQRPEQNAGTGGMGGAVGVGGAGHYVAPTNAGITLIASTAQYAHEAEVCIRSIRQHSTIPIHVFTSTRKPIHHHRNITFTDIETETGLWVKPKYMMESPFPLTLFLDTDVVVVHPFALHPFKLVESRFDIAWCMAPRRGFSHMGSTCVATWNSGVMFMALRSLAMQKTLAEYRQRYEPNKGSKRMSDQAILSRLVWKNRNESYTLAPEWNCRGFSSGCLNPNGVRIIHNRRATRELKRTGRLDVLDYCVQRVKF